MFAFLNFIFMLSYVSSSSFQKPLSAEDERKYLEEYKNGSSDAKNILIERNLRLVAHIAKKYSSSGTDNEDLISIGTIGLIKAVSSFKPEKSAKLSTYAAKCIENEILMHLRRIKKHNADISLSEPIGSDSDGNELTIMDILGGAEENIAENLDLKLKIRSLYNSIKTALLERERQIICLRYGLSNGDEITQREIAQELGISRSYVSRIEKKALQKLKKELPQDDGIQPEAGGSGQSASIRK